jgi:hypothetical protein
MGSVRHNSSPGRGGGARSASEGSDRSNPPRGFEDCRGQSDLSLAIERVTPLRQAFGLTPPFTGEELG